MPKVYTCYMPSAGAMVLRLLIRAGNHPMEPNEPRRVTPGEPLTDHDIGWIAVVTEEDIAAAQGRRGEPTDAPPSSAAEKSSPSLESAADGGPERIGEAE